eukprot:156799_1
MTTKWNRIVNEYQQKCQIEYAPTHPSSDRLLITRENGMNSCAHVFYPSSSTFIDHILWVLHPASIESKFYEQHLHVFMCNSLMVNICTNCSNIMLSKVSFSDILTLYSVWSRFPVTYTHMVSNNGVPGRIPLLNSQLYASLFQHPKIYRLLVKSCPLTKKTYYFGESLREHNKNIKNNIEKREVYVHNFDFLIDVMFDTLHRVSGSNLQKQCDDVQFNNDLYTIMLYLGNIRVSMKYWTKYHYLFLVKHCFGDMGTLGQKLQTSQIKLNHSQMAIKKFIGFIYDKVIFVLMKHHNLINDKNICDFIQKHVKINGYFDVETRKKTRSRTKHILMGWVNCAWSKCCKMNSEINDSLKVCVGCKMTYYCSKKCQKKGWKYGHRNICCKLSKQYHF